MEAAMTGNGAKTTSDGIVAAVQQVHEQIKSLLNEVASGGTRKGDAFETLAATAAAHEAAEQKVVHPLTQRAEGGKTIAADRISEEHDGEAVLEQLKALGVDDPQFDELFSKFRAAVLEHATNEETEEHPILERTLSAEASRQAADEFRAAQSVDA
jgi:hemerythrin superfamily protein